MMALIPYQPPGRNRQIFARNLTSKFSDKNHPPPADSIPCDIKPSERGPPCQPKPPPKSLKSKFFLLLVLVSIAMLSLLGLPKQPGGKCDPDLPLLDLKLLGGHLGFRVIGQAQALSVMLAELEEFQVTVDPLAIFVLLGGSGTGKTWTTHLIGEVLPVNAEQITLHLDPWTDAADISRAFRRIECCRWTFVFVEDSDYAGSRHIETLLDELKAVAGNRSECSNRKVVVILTSSHGGRELSRLLFDEFQQLGNKSTLDSGKIQDSVQKLDSLLMSGLIRRLLRFTRVPYLPLDRAEVRQCIVHDMQNKKKLVTKQAVENVMRNLRFAPGMGLEYFSVNGCKSVSTKVNLHS